MSTETKLGRLFVRTDLRSPLGSYAFDRRRVIDTVIMGNRRLWDALEERDAICRLP